MKAEAHGEWICDYCGVLIDNRRFRRREEQIFSGQMVTADCCILCHAILNMGSNTQISGLDKRREHIREVFANREYPVHTNSMGYHIRHDGTWERKRRLGYR